MEPQTWFKWSEVSKGAPLTDGQVVVPNLCLRFRMEEDSLEIADMQVAWSRATGYSSNLPELRRCQSGDGTKENPIQVNGIPFEDRGLLTEFEFLGSALQTAKLGRNLTTSLPSKIYLLQPSAVKKWKYLRPTDNGSGTLADAIRRLRESANRTKRKYVQDHQTYSTPVTNEAVVETLVAFNITHPLAIVAEARGHPVEWRQQHSNKLEAEAVAKAVQDRLATARRSSHTAAAAEADPSALQQATPAALAQSIFERHIRSPPHHDPDQHGSGSGGSSGYIRQKFDLVLVKKPPAAVATEVIASSSAAAAAAPPEPKSLCVGEVKGVQVLMDINGDVLDPIDLEQAWNDYDRSGGRSERSTAVHSSLSQLYTYMYSQGVCYGFISCYFGTWLANCPSSEPGTMYLSDCFRSNSRVSAETTRGALALLQDLALSTTDTFAVKVNDALDDSFLASGGGGDTNKAAPVHEPSLSLEDDGAKPGSQDLRMPSQGKSSGRLSSMHRSSDTQQGGSRSNRNQIKSSKTSSSSPFPPLVLGDKLCLGYAGPVYEGKYQQSPAIVKMLSATEASYQQETYIYKMIQPKQGELVPRMLAAGRVMHGISFIAVERIDGVALSGLPSVSKAVGAAALAALRSLANAFPGFLHGDIRLQNVLLVADGSDTTPKCMWIDFGQSRLNGTRQQQLAEEAKLKQLLSI